MVNENDIWKKRRKKAGIRPEDVRSDWSRDYARVIHSAAFRRLQTKTQVLGLGEGDFYRTRLTHSMEVAQIGMGIVNILGCKYVNKEEICKSLPDTSLMNAICLSHDLGHPPFGHGGEVALNVCMRNYGGFEGNGQTLRILSKLDKYSDGYGLNPTRRLLLGVLKYPVSYSVAVNDDAYGPLDQVHGFSKAKSQKPPKCYLDSEKDVVDWILDPFISSEREYFTSLTKSYDKKHHKANCKGFDTSIMELADDISYSLHDFEDSLALNMIKESDWRERMEGKEKLFNGLLPCNMQFDTLTKYLFSEHSHEQRKNAIGTLINSLMTRVMVDSVSESLENPLIKYNAKLECNAELMRKLIFELVEYKVIKNPKIQQLEFKGQKIVMDLFNAFVSDPERLLPVETARLYAKADSDLTAMRILCDYISGMTDEYAARMHERLYSPHRGSIFDVI